MASDYYDCNTIIRKREEGFGIVYYYEFEDGHIYVGATTQDLYKRHWQHIYDHPHHPTSPLDKFIRTGVKWHLSILEDHIPADKLAEREHYWIVTKQSFNDVNPLGFNRSLGGNKGATYCKSTRDLIGDYGRNKRTDETRALLRKYALERTYDKKPVAQYTLEGNLIALFKSAHEASRCTGVDRSGICRVCRLDGQKTAGGYRWKYAD